MCVCVWGVGGEEGGGGGAKDKNFGNFVHFKLILYSKTPLQTDISALFFSHSDIFL